MTQHEWWNDPENNPPTDPLDGCHVDEVGQLSVDSLLAPAMEILLQENAQLKADIAERDRVGAEQLFSHLRQIEDRREEIEKIKADKKELVEALDEAIQTIVFMQSAESTGYYDERKLDEVLAKHKEDDNENG